MYFHLRSYLAHSEPATAAKMVEVRGDIVGCTNVPDDKPRKWVLPASTKTPRVESPRNLSVSLFGGQGTDKFDDFRRSTNQVRSALSPL